MRAKKLFGGPRTVIARIFACMSVELGATVSIFFLGWSLTEPSRARRSDATTKEKESGVPGVQRWTRVVTGEV